MVRFSFILLVLSVLFSLSLCERNDPSALPLTVGVAPYAETVDLDVVTCESKYLQVTVPDGTPQSGLLRIETRQNSSGAFSAYLQSVHRPTDADHESSSASSEVDQVKRIDALCNFGAGNYFVGIKGTSSDPDTPTEVSVNATVNRIAVTTLNVDGTAVSKVSPFHPYNAYHYDLYRATEPRGVAASLAVTVKDVKNVPVTVYLNSGSQAGPNCKISSKVCAADVDEDCEIEVTPCAYTETGDWYLTVRSKAASYNTTAEYTISVLAKHPEVKTIYNGYNKGNHVLPGAFSYFKLPVNKTNEQLAVRVDSVNRGSVSVYLDFETPLGDNCNSAHTCQAFDHSGAGKSAICYLEIPFCNTQIGDYFIVVKGDANDREAPIEYTMEVLSFSPENSTIALGSSIADAVVSTSKYAEYALELPSPLPEHHELDVTIYTTDLNDKISITVANTYSGTCESASSDDSDEYSYEISRTCQTAAGENNCRVLFNTCELHPGTWWIKVEGVAPQHSDISYTLTTKLAPPQILTPGKPEDGAVFKDYPTHFTFDIPQHADPVAVELQLDSVSSGEVQILFREGDLAGCDKCYTNNGRYRIPDQDAVTTGGPYTSTAKTVRYPPFLFPSRGGKYFIAVRGNPDAGKVAVDFTMTLKVLNTAAKGTVTPNGGSIPPVQIALNEFAVYDFTPERDAKVFSEIVFNPTSAEHGTNDGDIYVSLYNAEFSWSEFETYTEGGDLPNPNVFQDEKICSLSSTTTTSCAMSLSRCDLKQRDGWKLLIWPQRSAAENENTHFDFSLDVRQPSNTPQVIELGRSLPYDSESALGNGESESFYYKFDVKEANPGEYLDVLLSKDGDHVSMYVHVSMSDPTGPDTCEGHLKTCSSASGSVACNVDIEPCDLKVGTYYATVTVRSQSSSRKPFSFSLKPSVKSALPLENKRGENGDAFSGVPAHYSFALGTLSNAAAFLEVQLTSVDRTTPFTVKLNTGSLAGCSSCLSYSETCTTSTQDDGGEYCVIRVAPCALTATANVFLAVSHSSGGSQKYSIKATLWDAEAQPKKFSEDIHGTSDALKYDVFKFDVPAGDIGKSSMTALFNSAEGTEPLVMYVLPADVAAAGGPVKSLPTGMIANPDASACASIRCTNTTAADCSALKYPINTVTSWLVGIKGTGSSNEYNFRLALLQTRVLSDKKSITSTLVAGSFEVFSYSLPTGLQAGGHLKVELTDVDGGGVELRANEKLPVRQSYPASGSTIEYNTAAGLRRTTGNSELCSGPDGCTVVIDACTTGSESWFFDVQAPDVPKNVSEYTITATYVAPTAVPSGKRYFYDQAFGDGAYRVYSVPAKANEYVSVFANTTDAGGATVKIGQASTSVEKCALSVSDQYGPCCKTDSAVIVEVSGAPRFNNSADFFVDIQANGPQDIPIGDAVTPLSTDVRKGVYRHFKVSTPANTGGGRWLVVTADGLDGTLYINPDDYAGDSKSDGGACLDYQFKNDTCKSSGRCTVNIEPCQVPDSAKTYYVSAFGSAALSTFTIKAELMLLNETGIKSGDLLQGDLAPYDYKEFILTVDVDTLSPLAFLEFQTQPPPPKPPSEPLDVNATASSEEVSVTVSWLPPSDNGRASITSYKIYVDATSSGTFTFDKSVSGALTEYTYGVGHVSEKTTYAYKVSAVNSEGESILSDPSDPVTTIAGSEPNVPNQPSVSAPSLDADTSVIITWSEPLNNGKAIEKYLVRSRDVTNNATWSSAENVSPAKPEDPVPTQTTITGLTANTTYEFSVAAYNSYGASEYSEASPTIHTADPTSAPGAPDKPTVALVSGAEDTQAKIDWAAPAVNGGSAITFYEVKRYIVGSAAAPVSVTTAPYTDLTFTDENLTPETNYTFTVTAHNKNPPGAESVKSDMITTAPLIEKAPGAPTDPKIGDTVLTKNSMSLSWTAPSNKGTPALTGYKIEVKQQGGAYQDATPATSAGTSETMTGLNPNTQYTFKITAQSTKFDSPSVESAAKTTLQDPAGKPTGVASSDPQANSVVLTWIAPVNKGIPALTTFKVRGKTSSSTYSEASTAETLDGTSTTATVTGLTASTTYDFQVFGFNGVDGEYSDAVSATTAAGAASSSVPDKVTTFAPVLRTGAENSAITATWTAPNDNGDTILAYEIEYEFAAGGGTTNVNISEGNPAPVDTGAITSLAEKTQYIFKIAAVNAAGRGAFSDPQLLTTQGVPDKYTAAVSTTTATSVEIEINTGGVSDGGSALTDWVVYAGPDKQTVALTTAADATTVRVLVTDLTANTAYDFIVKAVNKWGEGVASATISASTAASRRVRTKHLRRLLATADADAETAHPLLNINGRRLLASADDSQLDVSDGLWIRYVGADSKSHAGRDASCQTTTRIDSSNQIPEACYIDSYCTLLGMCDTPFAFKKGTYKIMIYNPSSEPASYKLRFRVVNPSVTPLTVNVPSEGTLDKFGAIGYTFKPSVPVAPAYNGWAEFTITGAEPGTKLSAGSSCTLPASCTVAAGDSSCVLQYRRCSMMSTIGSGSVFLKVTNGESEGNVTVVAREPKSVSIPVNSEYATEIIGDAKYKMFHATVAIPEGSEDFVDISLSSVVNGSVTLSYSIDGESTCSSEGSCSADSSMREPSCRARSEPCSAKSSTYYIIAQATSGYPRFSIKVSTVKSVALAYEANGSDDYLFQDQYLRYVYDAPANGTTAGSFLVAKAKTSNAPVAGVCTHDVKLGVADRYTYSAASPSSCDDSDYNSDTAEYVVDTCKFHSGKWYITARGVTAAGIDSPVNYRVSASMHEVKLAELPMRDGANWKNPTTYDGHVEHYFDVDSTLTSGSTIEVKFTFTPPSTPPSSTEEATIYLNRDNRIGYETNLEKSCLANNDNRLKRTASCHDGECTMRIFPCELSTGRYFIRVSADSAITAGKLTWEQIDNNVVSLAPKQPKTENVGVGHDTLQQYRINVNSSSALSMLKVKLIVDADKTDAGCSAKILLNRHTMATPSAADGSSSGCYVAHCSANGGQSCIAEADIGLTSSSTSNTCVSPHAANPGGEMGNLEGTWFVGVVGDCGGDTSKEAVYALAVNDELEASSLKPNVYTCDAVGEWGVTEYTIDTSLVEGKSLSVLDFPYTANSGSPTLHLGLHEAAGACTKEAGTTCLLTNTTYLGVVGDEGNTYEVMPEFSRPELLNLDLDSKVKVSLSALAPGVSNDGTHFFAIPVPAAKAAKSNILKFGLTIDNSDTTATVAIAKDHIATAAAHCSQTIETSCSGGGSTTCSAIELCGATEGVYYVRIDIVNTNNEGSVDATLTASLVDRPVKTVANGVITGKEQVSEGKRLLFKLAQPVAEGDIVTAEATNVESGSVKISLFKSEDDTYSCKGAVDTDTCSSGDTCTAKTESLCGEAGQYFVAASLASADCDSAFFQLTVTVTRPTYTNILNGVAFKSNLNPSQTQTYRLDVVPKPKNAPVGANTTVATITKDTYLTVRVSNPQSAPIVVNAWQANGGQCSRLLTRVTTALSDAEATCNVEACGYVVIPCRLSAGDDAGDVYVTLKNAGAAAGNITATVLAQDFSDIPDVPGRGGKSVNGTVLELYAIRESSQAKLVRMKVANDHSTLQQKQEESGKVRYWVNQNPSCPSSEDAITAVSGLISHESGERSVYEHNDRNGLPYGDATGAVLIVEGPSGRTKAQPKDASYHIWSATGEDACEVYDPEVVGEDHFCKVPQGLQAYPVWAPHANSTIRSSHAKNLADFIKEKFRCPQESRCGGCPGRISDICARVIDDFACASTYRRCDDDGFELAPCRTYACREVEINCGWTFLDVGLPEYACDAGRYVSDGFNAKFEECTKWEALPLAEESPIPPVFSPSPEPSNSSAPSNVDEGGKKLSTGVIIGAAVGGTVAVAAAAGVAMMMMKKKGGGSGHAEFDKGQV